MDSHKSTNLEGSGSGRVAFEPIAVVGMGLRFPGGACDEASLWKLLVEERDCIVDIPFSDAKDLRILFDRKNYGKEAFQKTHVDKAISDAQGTNADIIFLVYNELPQYAGEYMNLHKSHEGLLKMSGGFDPKKIYACTLASLYKAVMDALVEQANDNLKHSKPLPTNEEMAQACRKLVPEVTEYFEFMRDFYDLFAETKADKWTREVGLLFLRSKRFLQMPPFVEEKKELLEVFEKYFPEKSRGNFIFDGRKKRKLEMIDNDEDEE